MSFTNQTKKNTYSGDGVTAAFAFSFPILASTDLLVQIKDTNGTVTSKTITTHYTVSGTGNRTGFTDYTSGTVTFTAGNIPASTDTVIIKRNVPSTQETDYTEKGAFPAETHERALDKLTMLHLQQQEAIDRAVVFDSAVSFTGTLPSPSADKYIKFNSDATGFETVTLSSTAGLGNVVEDISPQLGGDLDLNSNDITGTGNINITGNITGTFPAMGASSSTATNGSTTTIIPIDDTIPQNTEGAELLTVTYACKNASSVVNIVVSIPMIAMNAANEIFVGAVFVDSVADAIGASAYTVHGDEATGYVYNYVLPVTYAPGDTSSHTYKFRYGPASATTAYVLQAVGTHRLGSIGVARITVTEVLV